MQSHLRELEDRVKRAAPGYRRAEIIRVADERLRKRWDDGAGLNRSKVSEWFVKGRVPQDFRILWEFVAVLLEAAGAPPPDSQVRRSWWDRQCGQWKALWELAGNTRSKPDEPATGPAATGASTPRAGEVGLDELGVHPSVRLESSSGERADQFPPYVPRDCDGMIDETSRRGGLVVIEGRSGSGKTRVAAESMRRILADRWLLTPDDAAALRQLAESAENLHDAVVWLNDLENFFGPSGLDVPMLSTLCPPGRTDVVLLATLRSEERLDLETHSAFGPARSAASDVLRKAATIQLPLLFSRSERERAAELRSDGRIAHWLDEGGETGLGEYLAAGPAAVARWLAGAGGAHVTGAALVSAAVDCGRAHYRKPVPLDVLSEMSEHYLDERDAHHPDRPTPDQALKWATTLVSGASSCLTSHAGRRYRAFDYLLDYQQRNEAAPPVPEPVLAILLSHATGDDFAAVFVVAMTSSLNADQPTLADLALARHGEVNGFDNVWQQVMWLLRMTSFSDVADLATTSPEVMAFAVAASSPRREAWDFGARFVRWLRLFAEADNPVAMGLLGSELCAGGDTQEGEAWLRRSAEAGNIDSGAEMARRLRDADRDVELTAWLDDAAAAGRGRVVVQFARQLIAEGHRNEAKRWCRRAAALGDPDAMVGLAELCREDDEWDETERLLRAAADAGHPIGMYHLGLTLMPLIGRGREAEEWFRKAADTGIGRAAVCLAILLHQRGATAPLDEWLDRERGAGSGDNVLAFAEQLAARGEMADAETWCRHAVDLGSTQAIRRLGDVLHSRGDAEGARESYHRAADLGDISAMVSLSHHLYRSGEPAEAERWLRLAVQDAHVLRTRPEAEDQVMTRAKLALAWLLDERGETQEAQQWYEEAAQEGNPDAMYNLGLLLERQGQQDEARRWFGRASDLGDVGATNALWRTYKATRARPPAGPDIINT